MQTTESPYNVRQRWNTFFHADEVPFGLALLRIGLFAVLLSSMIPLWPHARELYSTDGVTAQLFDGYDVAWRLPEFPGVIAVGLLTVLCVAMVMASIGWYTRFSIVVTLVLYNYFSMIDCVGTIAKSTCVATHIMIVLCFADSGAVFSVDAWRRRRNSDADSGPPKSALWTRRMIQLITAIVYFGAALTKLRSPGFFNGEQMTGWLLSDVYFKHPIGMHAAMHPALLILMGYVTMLWELTFIFLCWKGLSRAVMLGLGVCFHIATYYMIGIITFPFVFLALYFTFFSESEYRWFGTRMALWKERFFPARNPETSLPAVSVADRPRVAIPGMLLYGLIVLACVMVGIEAEHRLDPYGLRRPEGPHKLAVVPPEKASKMLNDSVLIREEDKFFAFDIGTLSLGGVLVNRKAEYDFGDTLIAHCALNTPHEDMWLQCNLHDAHNQIIKIENACATRELTRVSFQFKLNEKLLPGEYEIVLKSKGTEISRRRFVLGDPNSSDAVTAPVAN